MAEGCCTHSPDYIGGGGLTYLGNSGILLHHSCLFEWNLAASRNGSIPSFLFGEWHFTIPYFMGSGLYSARYMPIGNAAFSLLVHSHSPRTQLKRTRRDRNESREGRGSASATSGVGAAAPHSAGLPKG